MKTMFLLLSHQLNDEQKDDAIKHHNITKFVNITTAQWSQIPSDAKEINSYLQECKEQLQAQAKKGDALLVQGDFGATYIMVNFAFSLGLTPVYATTQREVTEEVIEGKTITKRTFKHVQFRAYEREEIK